MNFQFKDTKCGTSVFANNNKIYLQLDNCTCVKPIHSKKDKQWIISVKVPDDINDLIMKIDTACRTYSGSKQFINSVYENTIDIKIPFRYRKYECTFIDKDNHRITSGDFEAGDSMSLSIECQNLWSMNGFSGLLWRTNMLKKM